MGRELCAIVIHDRGPILCAWEQAERDCLSRLIESPEYQFDDKLRGHVFERIRQLNTRH
jgi:hypothetical protein